MKLGIAREIITPKIGCQLYGYRPDVFSESVADDLTATAFYFADGNKKALMITITVCILNTVLAGEIQGMIADKFSIPKSNIMLCATHTHSGPNTCGASGWGDIDREYCDSILIPQLMSATEKAMAEVQPVKMGVAHGISCAGINRRQLTPNNTIALGQNPNGCYNPKMTVISFKSLDGKPVANIIHYGMHGTCAGANTEITRDWSGVMTDTLEEYSGAITAFFNGPEGDVGPRLSNGATTGNLRFVYEAGHVAAQDAVRIYKTIFDYKDVELKAGCGDISVPLKNKLALEDAKTMLKDFEGRTVNYAGMMNQYLKDVISAHENGIPDDDATVIPQPVVALGNVVFAGTPYELFSEIGIRIDNDFKDAAILSLSNTNGSEGYFITEDAICRGGYEVNMFLYGHLQPCVDNADWHFYKNSVENIKKVIEND